MEIKNAFAIEVDFDGDIRSEATGFHVFAGDDALQETREILKTALRDLSKRMTEKCWDPIVAVGAYDYPIAQILESDNLLDNIIYNGGCSHGNWEINIRCTEE
jgi:hypothetical protein